MCYSLDIVKVFLEIRNIDWFLFVGITKEMLSLVRKGCNIAKTEND